MLYLKRSRNLILYHFSWFISSAGKDNLEFSEARLGTLFEIQLIYYTYR